MGFFSGKKKFIAGAEPALGDRAYDEISEFEGIVFGITDWLYSCRHVSLKPEELSKDKKPIDSASFDIQRIRVTAKGVHTPAKSANPLGIENGDHVRCPISTYEGIVVGITNWFNGDCIISVTPKGTHEGKPIESQGFTAAQLTIVAKHVIQRPGQRPVADEAKPAKKAPVAAEDKGGPADPKLFRVSR